MAEPIKIEGLAEFQRNLRKLDSDLPKALRIAFNDATGLVIDYARPRVPRRSGRAAGTIKAKSTRTEARVSGGGRRAPYYPWLDFGGKGPGNRPAQRPFYKEGRFLWKALVVKRDALQSALEGALIGVAEQAGFEVT
ncbi:HK97 gp10 family phage protein [Phytohabitans aurantiacus]|uniref:HK97 gp10 family phage protein n=1 Tax=Phytohabitans aurantiacus TaxID=3016789 RepID=A0ABQ5R2W8_9ACTN|nr:HK97 gp10 family phage protein [Phytohabitans aurantiacus]GLI00305.1 hypothetical protein Pa4123_55810 [Phytohabitans aurantiacus]